MNKQPKIDSAEARALADELARLTGEPVAEAVTRALRERIERARVERARGPQRTPEDIARRKALIRKIQEEIKPHLLPGASSDHSWLYDEYGLPK